MKTVKNNRKRAFAGIAAVMLCFALLIGAFAVGANIKNTRESGCNLAFAGFDGERVFYHCGDCNELFSYSFKDLINVRGGAAGDAVADGIVNAKDYAFLLKESHYYSTVDKAFNDANNLNYNNSDSGLKNAAAQLSIDNGTAYITLLKDAAAQSVSPFSQNAVINLNGRELSLPSGSGLNFEKAFSIYNGTVAAENASAFKSAQNNAFDACIDGVTFSETVTESLSQNVEIISLSGQNAVVKNTAVTAEGVGSGSTNIYGIITVSNTSLTVNSLDINLDCNGFARVQGTELCGTADLTDVNAFVSTVDSPAWGIRTVNGSNVTLTGAEVYVSCESIDHGTGITLNGAAVVNSTAQHPVTCFAKRQGLATSPYSKVTVNGGEYSACEHCAYIKGNADLYNCIIYNSNRELYNDVDGPYGVYLGDTNCPADAVCNFYSCRFGALDYSQNKYGVTMVTTNNYGYKSPRDVNFYDCEIYGGGTAFFSYNYPNANSLSSTRFNLYGNTVLYKHSAGNPVVSSAALASSINTWKTKTRYNSSTGKYNTNFVGDGNICGNCAKVDEDTGEVLDIYLTSDANVYDYR